MVLVFEPGQRNGCSGGGGRVGWRVCNLATLLTVSGFSVGLVCWSHSARGLKAQPSKIGRYINGAWWWGRGNYLKYLGLGRNVGQICLGPNLVNPLGGGLLG